MIIRIKFVKYDVMFPQEIPGFATYFMESPYDWSYKAKQRDTIAGYAEDRTIDYPRGFGLGGSR